jgi:hypothetical protein
MMMDVLVIGRNTEVLETVKEGLIARGISADGTTAAERASIDFNARDFAIVAFGGGVGSPLRETLKSEFKRQNPGVILLDTFAPVAVPHITAALRGDTGKRELASRFEISEDDRAYLLHLDLKKECDVSVDAYHAKNGFHGTTLGRGRLPAGPFVFRINEQEIYDGLNIILVTLSGIEFYLHRIEAK